MFCLSLAASISLLIIGAGPAQMPSGGPTMTLVVASGRALHVTLDKRITIRRVGQLVEGTLAEPVYAYDRIVLPAGTRVRGHVEQLVSPSWFTRVRAYSGGDFSPHRRIVLRFDELVTNDGRTIPMAAVVTGAVFHPAREVAASSERGNSDEDRQRGFVSEHVHEAVREAKMRVRGVEAAVRQPGKVARLEHMAIERLPYHPQFVDQGTMYAMTLTAPIDFGTSAPIAAAPSGTAPAPGSLVTARLVTPMNSSKTPRGTPIEAVVTVPVFSADQRLILPQGTRLSGEVTLARKARRLHHNGQLRFLFERVQMPEQESATMLASLHSVETSADDHVAIDDEGGARVTSSKTRFIAPALAVFALRASTDRGHWHDGDGDANDLPGALPPGGHAGARAVGSLIGFRIAGLVLGQLSRPVGIGFSVLGVARTLYTNVLGKGRDVAFPAGTPIQLQLAPGPSPSR